MLLDRIDIDAHGPLNRVELGPFAEHLNVVCSPQGSGKTAIVRFIRDSLVNREYPLGMLSSSGGRVVWADRNGLVHVRRERDGTATGRRTIEFQSRGEQLQDYAGLEQSWLRGINTSTDSSRAVRSIQLPESIVDGVITDAGGTSVARVVSACVRSGLDSPETYRDLPLHEESIYHDRDGYEVHEAADNERNRGLRAELADVETELAQLGGPTDHPSLVARRDWLTAQLARPVRVRPIRPRYDAQHNDRQAQLAQLNDRARGLRARQSELRRWIAEIGTEPATALHTRYTGPDYQYRAAISDENLRRQLDDLDAQMIRWRRALLEVRGLRAAINSKRSHFEHPPVTPLDEPALRRLRLDGFLHAVDRYDRSRSWNDLFPETYRPLHQLDDIDQRIDSATRQIDWLLERYAGTDKLQYAWFETLPETARYRSATNLGDALRAVREDLRQVQRYTLHSVGRADHGATGELNELLRSEQWLVTAIDQLNQHRESLLRSYASVHHDELENWIRESHYDRHLLYQERTARLIELDRVSAELDACLSEAASVRRSLRTLPVIDSWYDEATHSYAEQSYDWIDREALTAELRRIDTQLAATSRLQWLQARRVRLLEQLRSVRPVDVRSPLAAVASRWLVRLSAGRLQRIEWPRNFHTDTNSYHNDSYIQSGVTINGREENSVSAADRALAAMAVRMAAGDLLARTGRHVPLVFETQREMFGNVPNTSAAYHEHGDHFQSNHPFAAALRDYARSGRQVVVLTSNQDLTAQLGRVGARTFQIHGERVVHAHRPLWQSQSEHYAGPHPHTYGVRDAVDVVNEFHVAEPTYTRSAPTVDINRDFDMAWREAYGLYDNPQHSRIRHSHSTRTDWARDGVDYRDGYYFADTYTTVTPQEPVRYSADAHWIGGKGKQPVAPTPPVRVPAVESPFFLSVDSPIDQAPSIDAVAAARLRGLKVTHINHLMQQDSNRLADALGLANVDAATIRRWQSECRLVCRVPQLRGFDARILVGCGVTTPAELAAIHPVDLLRDVESFLSTPRGQQILLSGSSQELSRITSWIAAANSSSNRDFKGLGTSRKRNQEPTRQTARNAQDLRDDRDTEFVFDSDRYEYEYEHDVDGQRTGRRRRIVRTLNEPDTVGGVRPEHDFAPVRASRPTSDRNANGNGNSRANRGPGHELAAGITGGADNGNGRGNGHERQPRPRSRRTVTPYESTPREVVQYERDRFEREQRERRERDQTERASHERGNRERQPRQSDERRSSERELQFYLSRESPIVDAPSIGARMGDRLNAIGVDTVDALLSADPETLAAQLELRSVDADTALQWQQQATLVCRVPMLRGHDAQLLVLAGITTPEQLAACDAEELFRLIDPIANSAEGKRIIRNGKLPDLAEVTEWIDFAQHKRELRAA